MEVEKYEKGSEWYEWCEIKNKSRRQSDKKRVWVSKWEKMCVNVCVRERGGGEFEWEGEELGLCVCVSE